MQTEQTQNELIISETPGCIWIVGLFFALIGGIFVYGALGGFTDYDRHAPWTITLTFLMGSAAVGTGVWIIYSAPISKIVIDRIEETVRIRRWGLFGKQERFYAFEEIERFILLEEKDNEGDEVWALGMMLMNDETVRISSVPSHDERFKSNFVFQINEFMHKQLTSVEIALELGADSIEHGTGLAQQHIARLLKRNMSIAPTLMINDIIAEARVPVSAEAQEKAKAVVAERDLFFPQAGAAGVRFVLGTDASGIFVRFGDQLEEVRLMKRMFGWSAERALVAATSDAADALAMGSTVGHIAPGFGADFVIVKGRPWENIDDLRSENVTAVVSRGAVIAGELPR